MDHNHWLLELIPLAEEIKHGKGTPEKSERLAELILKLHNHLFQGGSLPQAWFVPMLIPKTMVGTEFDPANPYDGIICESGVHSIPEGDDDIDLSCFDAFEEPDLDHRQTNRRLPPVTI